MLGDKKVKLPEIAGCGLLGLRLPVGVKVANALSPTCAFGAPSASSLNLMVPMKFPRLLMKLIGVSFVAVTDDSKIEVPEAMPENSSVALVTWAPLLVNVVPRPMPKVDELTFASDA